METWLKCWKCEIITCGNKWVAKTPDPPTQCPRCHSRHWNTSGKKADEVKEAVEICLNCGLPPDKLAGIANAAQIKPVAPTFEPREATPSEHEEAIAEMFKDFTTVYDE